MRASSRALSSSVVSSRTVTTFRPSRPAGVAEQHHLDTLGAGGATLAQSGERPLDPRASQAQPPQLGGDSFFHPSRGGGAGFGEPRGGRARPPPAPPLLSRGGRDGRV